jgi:hypothetical protein
MLKELEGDAIILTSKKKYSTTARDKIEKPSS